MLFQIQQKLDNESKHKTQMKFVVKNNIEKKTPFALVFFRFLSISKQRGMISAERRVQNTIRRMAIAEGSKSVPRPSNPLQNRSIEQTRNWRYTGITQESRINANYTLKLHTIECFSSKSLHKWKLWGTFAQK